MDEPRCEVPCPECDGDDPECWRCDGEGWVEEEGEVPLIVCAA